MIPGVAVANALWSPGPLFYRQERVGKGGRPFQIVKFRSMVINADKMGDAYALWTAENDTRITPDQVSDDVGSVTAATRLSPLPGIRNCRKDRT